MPRRTKPQDLDFEIHVDPSCMSNLMEGTEKDIHEEPVSEVEGETQIEIQPEPEVADVEPASGPASEPQPELDLDDTNHEAQDDDPVDYSHLENDDDLDEAKPDLELDAAAAAESEHNQNDDQCDEEATPTDEAENHDEEPTIHAEEAETYNEDHSEHHFSENESAMSDSRRESTASNNDNITHRRASRRTEALIHEAARNIVAQIDNHNVRDSLHSVPDTEGSFISQSENASVRQSDAHMSVASESHSHHGRDSLHSVPDIEGSFISQSGNASVRQSDAHMSVANESQASTEEGERSGQDEGGDSSSHQENDSDVFSDHSPRSSVGSISETDDKKAQKSLNRMTRSPRISGLSQYEDDEEFVPTIRGTPRPAFRSPSSVRAIQMSSPPASVMGSPRMSRRSPLNTHSRLGSPSVSAQYSPKKTPPRFKRATPPLVLLHVTLLPLRWGWGDVLDQAETEDMSQDCKTVRDAWRQLQDRMGDTTVERGILLPHPQNDYEMLEERLLEALELPLRRRARILECGHYLGPSNEMSVIASDSEDDEWEDHRQSMRPSMAPKTHWCTTCRTEIRYESLGTGQIFRVKVYASNGLMKAGAWEACWKEMERVDVELEPLLDPEVQEELAHLEMEQQRALEMQEDKKEEQYDHLDDLEEEHLDGYPEEDGADHEAYYDEHVDEHHERSLISEHVLEQEHETSFREEHAPEREPTPPPASPEVHMDLTPEERQQMDEERLREIYGENREASPDHVEAERAAPAPETVHPTPSEPFASEYSSRQQSPPSPSVEAQARREERRQAGQSDSLPQLLLESARVLMQDRKNVMIALLSLFVLVLAIRGGPSPREDPHMFQTIVKQQEVPTVTVTQGLADSFSSSVSQVVMETVAAVDSSISSATAASSATDSADPCASCSLSYRNAEQSAGTQEAAPAVSEADHIPESPIRETTRVVETVTEVETATVKITETETEFLSQTVQPTESIAAQHEKFDDPMEETAEDHVDEPSMDDELSMEEFTPENAAIDDTEKIVDVEEHEILREL